MCIRSGSIEEELGRKEERKASHCSAALRKLGQAKGEIQTKTAHLRTGQEGLSSRTPAVLNHWLTGTAQGSRDLGWSAAMNPGGMATGSLS